MDMSQYLEIFIEEGKEHLQALNENILELEHEPGNMDILNEVFRTAHTLKGMAGTMGFTRMQKLTHDMENVLSEIRNGNISPNADMIDVLFKCLDALENYIDSIINTGSEGTEEYNDIIKDLNAILEGKSTKDDNAKEEPKEEAKEEAKESEEKEESSEVPLTEMDKEQIKNYIQQGNTIFSITVVFSKACVLKSARSFIVFRAVEALGEFIKSEPKIEDIEDEKFDRQFTMLVSSKEAKDEFEKDLNNIAEIDKIVVKHLEIDFEKEEKKEVKTDEKEVPKPAKKDEKATTEKRQKPKTGKTVRVDIDRLDTLMNLVSELIIVKTRLEGIEGNNTSNYNEAVEYLQRITNNLHDAVMKVRMVPVERVFNRFPRTIRDLSRKLNKDIELHMSGEETELDRNVIDDLGDPLIHLLRNAADHGLETPEEREEKGKPRTGNVYLKAYQDGNNVVIEVDDDGHGINAEVIKQKAIEKGVVSADVAANMTEQDCIELLFKPSFSMAKKITDVSGRGVGLDVVKSKIQTLGGDVEVKTILDKGTKFIVRLPLTLAIIQALMVKLGEEKYAIPLNTIQTIEDVNVKDIKYVQKQEVILSRNTVIPIVRLGDILEVPKVEGEKDIITVVIVKKGEKLAGFVVDSLIGQQEIVIKSLGKYLSGTKNIVGATILGDGEVALILDTNTLV